MVVDPVQPLPTIQDAPNRQYMSPEAIKSMREYAHALMNKQNSYKNPFYTWGNGLDDLTKGLMGGLASRSADIEEGRSHAIEGQLGGNVIRGNPDAPVSVQGGPPSAAAPGGAAPVSPFSESGPSATSAGAVDPALVNFVENAEGFKSTPYADGRQTSIGFGTRAKGPNDYVGGRAEGEQRLMEELKPAAMFVERVVPNAPHSVKAALTDLTYNTGTSWANAGLGHAVKSGDYHTAGQLFAQYNHAGGQVMPGLTARRMAMEPAFGGQSGGQPMATDLPPPQAPQSPYQTAQASGLPGQGPAAVPSRESSQIADYVRNMGMIANNPLDAKAVLDLSQKLQPQYGVNDYGQISRQAPGEMPSMAGTMPGAIGKVGTFGDTGLPMIQRVNPATGKLETNIQYPGFEGGTEEAETPAPKSTPVETTPPPTPAPSAPTRGFAQGAPPQAPTPKTAPVAPESGPTGGKGLLASNPVEAGAVENPWRLASNTIIAPGKPQTKEDIAKAEATAGAGASGDWKAYVARANKAPPIGSSYQPPDIEGLMRRAKRGDRAAQNALIDLKSVKASNLKKAEEVDTQTAKTNEEVAKSIQEGGIQGIKLQNSLKLAKRMLNSPNFESGKFAGSVTDVRNAIGEIKRFLDREKNEDGSPKYPNMQKWVNGLNAEKAAPNEVFAKVISGSVLQSLRSMLGPNSGQFRVQELKLLEQAYGNPNLSLEGNKVVMDIIDKLNDRSIVYNKMANEYKKTHNTLDANFLSEMDNYAEDHPAFQPEDYDKLLSIVETGSPVKEEPKKGMLETEPPKESNIDRLRRIMKEKQGK